MNNPKHTNRNSKQYQIIKTVLNLGNHTASLCRPERSAGSLRFPSTGAQDMLRSRSVTLSKTEFLPQNDIIMNSDEFGI